MEKKKTAGKLLDQVVDGKLAERLQQTWEGNAWILRSRSNSVMGGESSNEVEDPTKTGNFIWKIEIGNLKMVNFRLEPDEIEEISTEENGEDSNQSAKYSLGKIGYF